MLFDNNPYPMIKLDVGSNLILDVNKSTIRNYGYSKKDFLSMTFWDLFLPQDIEKIMLKSEEGVDDSQSDVFDWGVWQHMKKNGDPLYVHIFGQKISLNGQSVRLISMNNVTPLIETTTGLDEVYQRLRFHIDHSPLAFIEVNNDFRILQWSEKATSIFGWDKKEVIGKDYFEINMIFEEDMPVILKKMKAVKDGKLTNFRLQNRNYTKDGKVVFCEWYNSCFFDEYGQLKSILSQVQDITQRKTAELELQQERDFNERLINSLPGTFYVLDTNGHHVRWNKQLEEITGYSADEISRMKTSDFFEGEDKKLVLKRVKEVFTNGISSFEGQMLLKNGQKVPFYFTGQRFRQGNEDFIIGVGMDISDRYNALSELKETKNLFEKTFMNLDEAVLIVNPVTREVIKCNHAVKKILGYEMNELTNHYTDILYLDHDIYEAFIHQIITTVKKGGVFHAEFQLRKKDGQIIDTEHTVTLLNEEGRWEEGIVCVIRDITDKKHYEEELRIKDSAIESAGNAIALFNMNGLLSYANPAFVNMWGYDSRNEIRKVNFENLWDNDSETGKVINLLNTNGQWAGEMVGKRDDGILINIQLSANIVKDVYDDPICIMVSFSDITEQRKAREELEESQRMLSTLMGNLPGMAYRCSNDENWTMQFVSGGCFSLTGYLPQELIGNKVIPFADLILPEDRDMVWDQVQEAINDDKPYKLTYRIQTADKKIKWVWEKGLKVTLPNNEICLEGFVTDVTERVKAAEEIKRNEELFSGIFENSPVGIAMVDEFNRIRMVNKGFRNIFNYTSSEVIGKDIDELIIPPEKIKEEKKFFENPSSRYMQKETVRIARGGKPVSVLVYGVPIFLNDTQIADFGIYVDISDRKEAETKVRQSLQEKEVLLAEIHHRVKNNLAIISGLMELQASTTANDDARNVLQESQIRIKSIAMIHEKLYHSDTLSNIALDEYIESLVKNIGQVYKNGKKKIEVVTNTQKVLLNISQAIPFALLLNEIIVNTYKHAFVGKNRGKIVIELKLDGSNVSLKVSDDGVGLPENFNPKEAKSLGMRLITTLSKQLNADLEMINGNGLSTEIAFKVE